MSARFYDRDGQDIDHELSRRIVGLDLDQIRTIPIRVVAAGGLEKVDALFAAVSSGLISVLVTDTKAAQGLLARSRAESRSPSRKPTAKVAAKTRLAAGAP